MGSYYPSTCNPIDQHNCDPCETQELGRIRSVAFIAASYLATLQADPEDPTLWTTGIDAGDIFVIPETNGELSDPSPKTAPGFGDTVETLISFDQSLKFVDPNFASNCEWYNTLKKNRNFHVAFRTSSKTAISTKPAVIIPKYKVDNDLTSLVNWNVECKWQAADMPCPFDTPTGVFDECYIPN